jgi:hypothetical protein
VVTTRSREVAIITCFRFGDTTEGEIKSHEKPVAFPTPR